MKMRIMSERRDPQGWFWRVTDGRVSRTYSFWETAKWAALHWSEVVG